MVPPFVRMSETVVGVSSITRSSIGMLLLTSPFHPYLMPTKRSAYRLLPYFTIARIAALSPGQSPPPVSTPIFIVPPSLIRLLPFAQENYRRGKLHNLTSSGSLFGH